MPRKHRSQRNSRRLLPAGREWLSLPVFNWSVVVNVVLLAGTGTAAWAATTWSTRARLSRSTGTTAPASS